MKQITINIPDNYELKQDDNSFTIVEKKEKKLTYEDILIELKPIINLTLSAGLDFYATSCKMINKIHAINKLMIVAKYLNGDWQPNWEDTNGKFFIAPNHEASRFDIEEDVIYQNSYIYFKSMELAKQAIEILGEETIKLALCTDY